MQQIKDSNDGLVTASYVERKSDGGGFIKRTMDIVLGLIFFLLLTPVMALVAIAVKVNSDGPIFFRQHRMGLNGRKFKIIKFRTMFVHAEQKLKNDKGLYRRYLANNYKLPEHQDPRITSVGKLLRKLSLDEIPQIANVIKGDMSLVGPRPLVPDEILHYGETASELLSVRPGVTGLWQVNGRSTVGYPERCDLELEYVRKQSLGLDIYILLKTVPAVLWRRGAF